MGNLRQLLLCVSLLALLSSTACGSVPSSAVNSGTSQIQPPSSTPQPSASISLDPIKIDQGQSSTLKWETANATEVSIDPLGFVQTAGTQTVSPKSTTTYTINVKGAGGTATGSASLTVVRHKTVVFIGDSRVSQWNLATYFPGENFINKGVSGENTSKVLARFDADVVQLKPDVVVIFTGTAGMSGDESLEQAKADIPAMVQKALAANIVPIVCSVPPTGANDYVIGRNAVIALLNEFLYATYPKPKVLFADFAKPMTGPDGYVKDGMTIDGVHFTPAGYSILAPIVKEQIDSVP